jgi:LSD1 subclass zinc finger protein
MSKEVWNGQTAEGQVQQSPPPAYSAAPVYAQPPQQSWQQPPPVNQYAPPQQQGQYSGGAYQMGVPGAPVYQPQPQAPVYYGGQPGAPSPYSQPQAPPQQPVYYAQNVPMQQMPRGPAVVQGGAACRKCGVVYPLPRGSTSWRCKSCNEFNNLNGDQCIIL